MVDLAIRADIVRRFLVLVLASTGIGVFIVAGTPRAEADATAYLIAVIVRPGYNFASAEAALNYGHGICDKLRVGRGYSELLREVEADFSTSDEYQAQYLINEATDNLCPAQIWQLRNSGRHYVPPAGA